NLRRETSPHRVFCDSPLYQELQQVIRSPRLAADARHLEAAERLAVHQGPRDLAVDVQVADAELALDALDVLRAAGIQPARQRVRGAVGDLECLVQVGGPQDGQHGAEDLLLGDDRRRLHVGENVRGDEGPLLFQRPQLAGVNQPALVLTLGDVIADALAGLAVDDRADSRARVVRWGHLHAPRHLDEAFEEGVVQSADHDDARAGRALLPGVAEGAVGHAVYRFVQVGVVVHDDGVLAAQLSDDALDVILPRGLRGGLAVDEQADVAR